MGNRAVITSPDKACGVYLHWNGGPESVLGFCEACKKLGYRDPAEDPVYGLARLAVVVGVFLGVENGLSLGIGALPSLDCDNGDNGVYVVGRGWQIVERYWNGPSRRLASSRAELPAKDLEYTDRIRDTIVRRLRMVAADAGGLDGKEPQHV